VHAPAFEVAGTRVRSRGQVRRGHRLDHPGSCHTSRRQRYAGG
jgi:hypothetical protein